MSAVIAQNRIFIQRKKVCHTDVTEGNKVYNLYATNADQYR